MKVKICDVNPAAESKLPEHTGDKSGIGVHYVDAFIKPILKQSSPDAAKVQATYDDFIAKLNTAAKP